MPLTQRPKREAQERRKANSTFDELWSTVPELARGEAERLERRTRTKGVTPRGEWVFTVASTIFILFLAIAWSWSIALARSTGRLTAGSAAGILRSALTDEDAPSMAYLTDAALTVVDPLRGESGKLRAQIQQPGEALSSDTLRSGAVATFSSGAAAESSAAVVTAPRKTGIWSLAIALGNAIRPVTDFSVITLFPASQKRAGKIGLYYIGNWPSGRTSLKADYTPPGGFIEVTQQTQNTALSDHFRLKDFFPHDQQAVWPKYIVVKMNSSTSGKANVKNALDGVRQ